LNIETLVALYDNDIHEIFADIRIFSTELLLFVPTVSAQSPKKTYKSAKKQRISPIETESIL